MERAYAAISGRKTLTDCKYYSFSIILIRK